MAKLAGSLPTRSLARPIRLSLQEFFMPKVFESYGLSPLQIISSYNSAQLEQFIGNGCMTLIRPSEEIPCSQ